jgi:hypothetical protein
LLSRFHTTSQAVISLQRQMRVMVYCICYLRLIFSERDALADGAWTKPGASYSNIEFSSTRRGTLATLERDSTYVRFWDLAESRAGALNGSAVGGGGSSDGETNKSSRDSNRASRKSWAAIPWPSGGEKEKQQHISKEKDLPSSLELLPSQQHVVLADTRRSKLNIKNTFPNIILTSEL